MPDQLPTFSVIWNRVCHQAWRRGEPSWRQQAILLRRCVIAGKPQLKIVCCLASVREDCEDVAERENFWHQARQRLGKMRQVSPRDRDLIEHMLSERVPRPVPVAQAAAGDRAESLLTNPPVSR